jgi:hypothetical protein
MRPTSVGSILAGLMCGAAVAGFAFAVGPEPVHVTFEGDVPGPWTPCANNTNVEAHALECAFPNEVAFRVARTRALAPDQMKLRRAMDQFDLQQAVWAWRRISRTEERFDRFHSALEDYWATGIEPSRR